MLRPQARVVRDTEHGVTFLLAALVFALSLAFAPVPAFAQDPQEVPLGVFDLDLGSPGPTTDPRTPAAAPGRLPVPAGDALDEATEELFNDGVAALEAGRAMEAQRLFEQMIARAPASRLAAEARRYLADLYQRSYDPSALPPPNTPADPAPAPSVREAAAGPVPGPAAAPPDGRRAIAVQRVSTALEEEFVAEAGDRVFFSLGSAELGTRARGVLAAQARFILRRSNLIAMIEGHADDATLSAEQHIKLSQARAEAVRQRLVEEGIDPNRLTVVALGREQRVSECPEPECAAQNRRAVTVLMSNGFGGGPAPLGGPRSATPRSVRGPGS